MLLVGHRKTNWPNVLHIVFIVMIKRMKGERTVFENEDAGPTDIMSADGPQKRRRPTKEKSPLFVVWDEKNFPLRDVFTLCTPCTKDAFVNREREYVYMYCYLRLGVAVFSSIYRLHSYVDLSISVWACVHSYICTHIEIFFNIFIYRSVWWVENILTGRNVR